MSDKRPTPEANVCTNCGHEGLTVACEVTEYASVTCTNGRWVRGKTCNTEVDGSEDSVRLFCENCGTYYEVPENLEY